MRKFQLLKAQKKSVKYLSIFCNKRAKRNNRVSLTKCMWDSCEKCFVEKNKAIVKFFLLQAKLNDKNLNT